QQSTDLLATMEAYLKHPLGMVIGGFAVFFLYVLLSLRYVPQEFGLERAQSTVLVFLAILVPHLLGIYTVGQRLGLIQL
ncbi:MAG: hypothetical protein O7J95_07455, partial [Planctomycetota bacterium]|nr:hypothetical protein [Planctomycetota bacterium]